MPPVPPPPPPSPSLRGEGCGDAGELVDEGDVGAEGQAGRPLVGAPSLAWRRWRRARAVGILDGVASLKLGLALRWPDLAHPSAAAYRNAL